MTNIYEIHIVTILLIIKKLDYPLGYMYILLTQEIYKMHGFQGHITHSNTSNSKFGLLSLILMYWMQYNVLFKCALYQQIWQLKIFYGNGNISCLLIRKLSISIDQTANTNF